MTTVYVSIGNSDDKLSQEDWSCFVEDMAGRVASYADVIHGAWHSLPNSRYQNACWCLEFSDAENAELARSHAAEVRQWYRQDPIAWAVAETEFI